MNSKSRIRSRSRSRSRSKSRIKSRIRSRSRSRCRSRSKIRSRIRSKTRSRIRSRSRSRSRTVTSVPDHSEANCSLFVGVVCGGLEAATRRLERNIGKIYFPFCKMFSFCFFHCIIFYLE